MKQALWVMLAAAILTLSILAIVKYDKADIELALGSLRATVKGESNKPLQNDQSAPPPSLPTSAPQVSTKDMAPASPEQPILSTQQSKTAGDQSPIINNPSGSVTIKYGETKQR